MTDAPSSPRFAVNVWNKNGDRDGEETTHHTFIEARDAARKRWVEHKGTCRVTIWDDYAGIVLTRLDPGPLEVRDALLCHDPGHDPAQQKPKPAVERRSKRR